MSSQAFIDRYGKDTVATLMQVEATCAILKVMDRTIACRKALTQTVVYDSNEPGIGLRIKNA